MPPKAKYTREQIIDTAYSMVRKHGRDFLTARSLASELGTSTAPIFTAFESIDDVYSEVVAKAKLLYSRYHEEGLLYNPPFKGAGLKYIQFAKDEPELFKLLFMSGEESELLHYAPAQYEYEGVVRGVVKDNYGLDDEKAKRLYNHMTVYTHGLAVLFAQGYCIFSDEDVSRMLSEIFSALSKEDEE